MQNITLMRSETIFRELKDSYYKERTPLNVTFVSSKDRIPYDEIDKMKFEPISLGTRWGDVWDSAWFKFSGVVPQSWDEKEVVALIDLGGEGCVFKNGSPYQGLTNKVFDRHHERKRRIEITKQANCEDVNLLVEAAANGLFGDTKWNFKWIMFTLQQAELAVFDKELWQLSLDFEFLIELYKSLDEQTARAKRILKALNDACNINPFVETKKALEITKSVINTGVCPSALTAYSVGHSHIDLAWLWRYCETRRKAGRTFSTVLRMMEEYPSYVFGASQPQLFDWVKQDYPKLYEDIKEKIKEGRFECQGAMWVEPDMNITGGESLVRQCFYGKKFFREEFGKEIDNLWLPDVFGYSGALPQILKKSNVNYFMTQKISWNETNTFPHHTFNWKGIDGTSIVAHFLPTNTYNFDNRPGQFIETSKRFIESDIENNYLNLYGIGDGGGGPSRKQIEFGLRSENCEGLDKFKFTTANEFFESINQKDLPSWNGELYLEFHRGTFTTQAKTKKNNRKLEHLLRDVEFLSTILENKNLTFKYKKELERVWKATLCNQFHDVLPGSSIHEVYIDEAKISKESFNELEAIKKDLLNSIFNLEDKDVCTFINTQPWERNEIVEVDGSFVNVNLPSMGYISYKKNELTHQSKQMVTLTENGKCLSNGNISVNFDDNGAIVSLKKNSVEFIDKGKANIFRLFDDKTILHDAWDVHKYYTEVASEVAQLVDSKILVNDSSLIRLQYTFKVGSSTIIEQIELRENEDLVRITCDVDWKETHKMLRYINSSTVFSDNATYEIQYGNLSRSTHSNTSWDDAKFEVCGHRFVDLSQANKGLSLVNDCKYGYRIHDNILEVNLLRSPTWPDATADKGQHNFKLGIYPHNSSLADSNCVQVAHNFNSDIIVLDGKKSDKLCSACFTATSKNIKVEVAKIAEYVDGYTIRCYETLGIDTICSLESEIKYSNSYESDMEELHLTSVDLNNLEFKPFEIRTFILEK